MKTIHLLIRKIRNLGVGGFVREIVRRLNPISIWHGTLSKNRKVIKMTGVGHDPNETLFYPSVYHFLHNVPSVFAPKDYDYLLAQSYITDEFLSCQKPKLFFTREPIPAMSPKARKHIQSEQLKPCIYSYEEPDIEKRMFYVVFYESKKEFVKNLERSITAKREKLCCIVNRYSENEACNLVPKRIEFVKALGKDIDIYGAEPGRGPNKWKTFPNYHGMANDKLKTLGEYNFVLAFENTDYPGYITEKIIHAFMAGTIPLYWGGGGYLKESVPSNCYVDCRDQDPHSVHKMIKAMSQEEIISYRMAAIDFLKSKASDRFTREYWAEEVAKKLDSLNSSKNPNIPAKANQRINGHDNNNETCWPTWGQELLLKAALLQGEDAISAWESWKAALDLEQLDAGSHNLLPLLHNNLSALGIKDPLMKKLKGVYRQTWYKNKLSIHRIGPLLGCLHDAGIETMVLKGAALTPLYYRNYGLRPMSDIDVLVPSKKAREAINVLIESGWAPASQSPENQIPIAHGTEFRSTSGQIIDLHWHVLHECRRPDVDARFWERALVIKLNNVSTHALSPTDQLLHILVHGIKWNPDPPFRWVADAVTIINTAQSKIDWHTLIGEAKEYRLILPVKMGLVYLRSKFNASIPHAILETIQNTPASRMERIEHRYKTGNYLRKPLGYMPILWFDYWRLQGNKALLPKVAGFLEYLRLFWGAENLWQLPRHVVSMTARKIRTMVDYHGKG